MRGHACHFFSTFFPVPVLDPESVRVPDPDPFPVLPFHVHSPVPDTDPFNIHVPVLIPFPVYFPVLGLVSHILVS
jgi:hypothetical protein